jgi:hypothetical protein
MNRIIACWCGISVAAALSGCGGKNYDGEQRYPLSGKVAVDGQPVGRGLISFLPQDKEGKLAGGPIIDGAYAIPEEKGATAGKYRVEIHWNKPTGRKIKYEGDSEMDETVEGLPARYNKESELTIEVGQEQKAIDFLDLKSEGAAAKSS